MLTLATLNAMPRDEAADALLACCGSRAWVEAMLVRRPFGTRSALLRTADDVSGMMHETDWLEAFAHHPRIGERAAAAPVPDAARGWSADEQTAVGDATDAMQRRLVALNTQYESQFGFVFIIRAAGRGAGEILDALERRLAHDRVTELGIAAAEQCEITRLRLEKLIVPHEDGGP